jgi:hypothetical protein
MTEKEKNQEPHATSAYGPPRIPLRLKPYLCAFHVGAEAPTPNDKKTQDPRANPACERVGQPQEKENVVC